MEDKIDHSKNLIHLFPELNTLLLELLRSLQPADWERPTVARLWRVKDVAAHLLDGNIRVLSMLRDGYAGESPSIHSPQELLDYLNALNADWVKAMKRVSPAMLITLHEITGPMFTAYYAGLDPFSPAIFAVNWTGETQSINGTHVAREYTEKWLHQQQIRHAVGNNALMERRYFHPFINVFMLALPYTFRNVEAPLGGRVRVTIPGEAGGSWEISRGEEGWALSEPGPQLPMSEVVVTATAAWQLFSKSKTAEALAACIHIKGNQSLGEVALRMVAVMA